MCASWAVRASIEKQSRHSNRLSQTIDGLNRRYGKKVVDFGFQQDHPGFFERG
ncbi:MAG: DUF4113 domain-containing protein [Rhodobacteraceae bacterium]|nr:DUF4113 domain-containing protein [Paracoccaceae bacterium]